MATPEGRVKKAIVEYLSLIPHCEIFPISTIGVYDASTGRLRKSPMRPGTPDLILCYRGIFVGIEVKAEKGRLSDNQKEIGVCITDAGGIWGVARDIEDVRELLKRAELRLAPMFV